MDPLKDLHNYSGDMTISQVVRFFERRDIKFTKTMIQNYVRVGVLEPPDGRVYHAGHLKTLVLIEYLKQVYSLDEIKSLFETIDISESYEIFLEMYDASLRFWDERAAEGKDGLKLELAAFCAATKQYRLDITAAE